MYKLHLKSQILGHHRFHGNVRVTFRKKTSPNLIIASTQQITSIFLVFLWPEKEIRVNMKHSTLSFTAKS